MTIYSDRAVYEPSTGSSKQPEITETSVSLSKPPEIAKSAPTREPQILEVLVHPVALVIVGGLALNITGRFWQDISDGGSGREVHFPFSQGSILMVLYFAAGLHEIFMLAFISSLTVYYVKIWSRSRDLTLGYVDPFYYDSPLSMLCLWLPSKNGVWHGRQDILLAFLLLVVFLLSIFVGPSSSTLMIPSLRCWPTTDPFGGKNPTTYFLPKGSNIWPSTFDLHSFDPRVVSTAACQQPPGTAQLGCPFDGYMSIMKQLAMRVHLTGRGDTNFVVSETFSNATRSISSAVNNETYTYQINSILATSSYTTSLTQRMVLFLGSFWSHIQRFPIGLINSMSIPRLRVQDGIDIYQPVVHVICQSYIWNGTRTAIPFPSLQNMWNAGSYLNDTPTVDSQSSLFDDLPSKVPRFSWFKDTRLNSTTSLLALSILPIFSKDSTGKYVQGADIVPCSIDARWVANTVSYEPMVSNTVLTNLTDPSVFGSKEFLSPEEARSAFGISDTPIDLALDWTGLLDYNWRDSSAAQFKQNVTSDSANTITTMTSLLWMVAEQLRDVNYIRKFGTTKKNGGGIKGAIEKTIANLLGVVLTDAISRTSYWDPFPFLETSLNESSRTVVILAELPDDITLDTNATFFDRENSFSLTYNMDRYGCGYGITDERSLAALARPPSYYALDVLHACYIILKGIAIAQYFGIWLEALVVGTTHVLRRREPENGKRRIKWKCKCGDEICDDFLELKEGAVESFREIQQQKARYTEQGSHDNQNIRNLYVHTNKGQNSQIIKQESIHSEGGTHMARAAASIGHGIQYCRRILHLVPKRTTEPDLEFHQSEPEAEFPGHCDTTDIVENKDPPTSEILYLLLCYSEGRYATRLLQLDLVKLQATSDKVLFEALRANYKSMRGKWLSWFSLRTLSRIKFVHFEMYKSELVDVRKVDDLPPPDHEEYRYLPAPPQVIPPIGDRHMMHLFQHPECAEDEALCVSRFPKKLRDRLKCNGGINPGWGLHFVEGWDWRKICIAMFICFGLGSLLIGILWARYEHSIQDAIAIAAYMVGFATVTMGTFQAVILL